MFRIKNKERTKKEEKRDKILSRIFMGVIFLGALLCGVCLVLSETLYPQIENFFDFPLWYRLTLYASLLIVAGGIIGCSFTKTRENTQEAELSIELLLCGVGIGCIILALTGEETSWKDVVLGVGGVCCAVGFFCGVGTMIGLNKRAVGKFSITANVHKKMPRPASKRAIKRVEDYFQAALPDELVEFLLRWNGDNDAIFSTKLIVEITKSLRETYKEYAFAEYDGQLEKLVFFGGIGNGDYFCYKIDDDGHILDDMIYLWDHELNELNFEARTLKDLLDSYYHF